jgi:general secretion pathway protein G
MGVTPGEYLMLWEDRGGLLNVYKKGKMKQTTQRLVTDCPTKRDGFSFIEIMIVIVIMAGIVAIVGPALFGKLDQAKVDEARIQMKGLMSALDLYHLDNSTYPSSEQGLEALVAKPEVGIIPEKWRGPYLRSSKIPKDPWAHDYFYQSDGGEVKIMCLGADGEEGGEGINADITID